MTRVILAGNTVLNIGSVKTIDNLLALINNILDLAKIESSEIKLENTEFSISEMLAEFSEAHALDPRKKYIKFSVEQPSTLSDLRIGIDFGSNKF